YVTVARREYYAPQFQYGKATLAEADKVAVTAGSTKSGIDAALKAGGQITGKVTDASTKAALSGVLVCLHEASSRCIFTDSGGEYTFAALASGEYKVSFERAEYAPQFYNGKATLAEA